MPHDVVVHNVLNKILALRVIVDPAETRNRVRQYFEGAYIFDIIIVIIVLEKHYIRFGPEA